MTDPDRPLLWLASYPKSGNTWARVLLAHYLAPAGTVDPGIPMVASETSPARSHFDDAAGLVSSDLTPDEIDALRPLVYRRSAATTTIRPLFVKLHDAYRHDVEGNPLFPPDRSQGAILIVRHPLDVAISYQHHVATEGLDAIVARMCNPQEVIGGKARAQYHQRTFGWSGHYLSWTRQRDMPVLVVRYEDMIENTPRELARIVDFAGLPVVNARIAAAVEQSRFDRLQAAEMQETFRELPTAARHFFRSGRIGEGIAALPDALRRRMIDANGPVMAELGYTADGVVARDPTT